MARCRLTRVCVWRWAELSWPGHRGCQTVSRLLQVCLSHGHHSCQTISRLLQVCLSHAHNPLYRTGARGPSKIQSIISHQVNLGRMPFEPRKTVSKLATTQLFRPFDATGLRASLVTGFASTRAHVFLARGQETGPVMRPFTVVISAPWLFVPRILSQRAAASMLVEVNARAPPRNTRVCHDAVHAHYRRPR